MNQQNILILISISLISSIVLANVPETLAGEREFSSLLDSFEPPQKASLRSCNVLNQCNREIQCLPKRDCLNIFETEQLCDKFLDGDFDSAPSFKGHTFGCTTITRSARRECELNNRKELYACHQRQRKVLSKCKEDAILEESRCTEIRNLEIESAKSLVKINRETIQYLRKKSYTPVPTRLIVQVSTIINRNTIRKIKFVTSSEKGFLSDVFTYEDSVSWEDFPTDIKRRQKSKIPFIVLGEFVIFPPNEKARPNVYQMLYIVAIFEIFSKLGLEKFSEVQYLEPNYIESFAIALAQEVCEKHIEKCSDG